ncbi:hypothetical protein PG995_004639 [Apiospora arundinis]
MSDLLSSRPPWVGGCRRRRKEPCHVLYCQPLRRAETAAVSVLDIVLVDDAADVVCCHAQYERGEGSRRGNGFRRVSCDRSGARVARVGIGQGGQVVCAARVLIGLDRQLCRDYQGYRSRHEADDGENGPEHLRPEGHPVAAVAPVVPPRPQTPRGSGRKFLFQEK